MARINQSAAFTLQVLEQLAKCQPAGVSTLARDLGTPKSNVQRALMTLRETGWIRSHNEAQGPGAQWILGHKLLSIGGQVGNERHLRDLVIPHLELLRLESGETVGLAMRDGDHWVIVDVREGSHPVRAVANIGTRTPLDISGTGHLILAYLSEEEREQVLSHRKVGRRQRRLIQQRIREIHRDGFVYSKGEMLEGAAAVAAPILDASGRLAATIGITVPTHRVTPAIVRKFGEKALLATRAISKALR